MASDERKDPTLIRLDWVDVRRLGLPRERIGELVTREAYAALWDAYWRKREAERERQRWRTTRENWLAVLRVVAGMLVIVLVLWLLTMFTGCGGGDHVTDEARAVAHEWHTPLGAASPWAKAWPSGRFNLWETFSGLVDPGPFGGQPTCVVSAGVAYLGQIPPDPVAGDTIRAALADTAVYGYGDPAPVVTGGRAWAVPTTDADTLRGWASIDVATPCGSATLSSPFTLVRTDP